MLVQIILALFLCGIQAKSVIKTVSKDNEFQKESKDPWNHYKLQNSLFFDEHEDFERREIFEKNRKLIKNANEKSNAKVLLKENHLMHLKPEEISRLFGSNIYVPSGDSYVPSGSQDPIDWVKKGAVTSVKNQGQCGSCWAFSAVGSLEGAYFRKYGSLVDFAPQELVDCSKAYGNQGCNCGFMDYAFQYVIKYGIEKQSDYPYYGKDMQCHVNVTAEYKFIDSFVDVVPGSEKDLSEALKIGPVSVAIDASPFDFMFYAGGVLNPSGCSTKNLNHGVLLVGQGTTQDGQDYYLIKNSWGTMWGMRGYAMLARNNRNTCGIASAASYPTYK